MDEPFLKTLTRDTLLAVVVAVGFLVALPRHASLAADFVDVFLVAFCFSFLGHYVDVVLLALPEIHTGLGRLVRGAGWFAGGLWCYVIARWLWIKVGRDLNELPALVWGGVFFVVLELAIHAGLQAMGRRNVPGEGR